MLSKSLSFRKGRDDGDWRLGWKGNCGTSRHQPLLSVATHILFLSTTLSWGQCPFWSGQGVVPECYARDEHREPLTQPLQLADPRRRVLTDYTRLEGGINPNLDGILPAHLGIFNESGQTGGKKTTKRPVWRHGGQQA